MPTAGEVRGWKAQGLSASCTRRDLENGTVACWLKLGGQGQAQLNAPLFDNQATLAHDAVNDPPQNAFRYVLFGGAFDTALSRKFSLCNGKINSSNGLRTLDSTMTSNHPVKVIEVAKAW